MPRRKREPPGLPTAVFFNEAMAAQGQPYRLERRARRFQPTEWVLVDESGPCLPPTRLPEDMAVVMAMAFVAGVNYTRHRQNERTIREQRQELDDLLARVPVDGTA